MVIVVSLLLDPIGTLVTCLATPPPSPTPFAVNLWSLWTLRPSYPRKQGPSVYWRSQISVGMRALMQQFDLEVVDDARVFPQRRRALCSWLTASLLLTAFLPWNLGPLRCACGSRPSLDRVSMHCTTSSRRGFGAFFWPWVGLLSTHCSYNLCGCFPDIGWTRCIAATGRVQWQTSSRLTFTWIYCTRMARHHWLPATILAVKSWK